jgi:chemotaxis signal transduction protein
VTLVDETYPVTDLAERLELAQVSKTGQARVILCSMGGRRAAFPVDAVAGLVDVQRSQVVPLAKQFRGQERQWFHGVFPFEETGALVVNVDWVVKTGDRPALVTADLQTTAVVPSKPRSKPRVVDIGGIQLEEATDAENTPWASI